MPGTLERVDSLVTSFGGQSKHLADSTLLATTLALQALDEAEPNTYLRQLPIALDTPLLWPAPLRTVLLQGTSCHAACESQAALSDKLFEVIDGDGGPGLSKPHFRWGQALLLSRAHSGDGKPFALVPALDLLNHAGSAAGASVRFDAASSCFELVAERAHDAGEELLIDYGVRGSGQLLRRYGFVPQPRDESDAAGVIEADDGSLAQDEEVSLLVMPPPSAEDGAPKKAAVADGAAACDNPTRPVPAEAVVLPLRWSTPPTTSQPGRVELPFGGLSGGAAGGGQQQPEAVGAAPAREAVLDAIDRRLNEQLPGYE
eukprot:3070316-Prymnesium_polylepis.1